MLGFEFRKNFDYPYISRSITEFWRRWHISLGSWFREYVYIPLGGNRRGLRRQLLNLLIVWALTGLWHGASWNFVLWGLYFGLLLTMEKLFLLRRLEKLPGLLRSLLVLLAVSFGWVLFSFPALPELGSFLRRFLRFTGESTHTRNLILAYLPLLVTAALGSTPLPARFAARLQRLRLWEGLRLLYLAALMLLCTAALASQSYNPFIYFRF